MTARLAFHGVRGSTPCHSDETRRYGGNTSCVTLEVEGEPPVLFDLGTGLRYFGRHQSHDGSFHAIGLVSHLHWDHTQGLPFFTPILQPGSRLDVYAPAQDDGRPVGEVFAAKIQPPMFPVGLADLPGTFTFTDVADDEFDVGHELHVMSRRIPHVGPTVGFRVEIHGHGVAYVPDHQQPPDGSFALTDGAYELMRGVDVLVHDAQYTPEEFELKRTWGHCTIDYAVWVAAEVGARTLVLFHHDPSRHDDELDRLFHAARDQGACRGVEVIAATEGLKLDL